MLEAKLPDTGILFNPSMGRPKSVTETERDIEFIRNSVETMADPAIAKALGWKQWRVLVVRHEHGIPAHTRDGFWTDEKRAELKRICIDECKTNVEAAAALGCSPIAVKRKLERLGWTRDPQMLHERRVAVNKEVGYRPRRNRPAPKPKPVVVAAHAVVAPAPIAPKPYQLHYAPIVFAAPRVETETLGDRILRELSAKPLSCPSLATLLGVNEELVSRQLRVFEHEGLVVSGSVDDRGQRYRSWTYIGPSVAESAASLHCGPDSLVVAGEAA